MYQLSEQETDRVYARLHNEGISSRRLEQDLLDHFCCYMESRMEEGADFETAYKEAVNGIAPNGLKEIEFELFFIMNFNKQLSMKRFIFLTGFLATFLISTGLMFRLYHWLGANVLLFSGIIMLLVSVLATVTYMVKFFQNKSGAFWLRTVSGVAAVLLISVGFTFSTFVIPGAYMLLGLGALILNFIFLPALFLQLYRQGLLKTA